MELISLLIGIISLIIALASFFTLWFWKGRLTHISGLLSESLSAVKKGIGKVDLAVYDAKILESEHDNLRSILLDVENGLERSIRRIMLFGGDKEASKSTVDYFSENWIIEDAIYIDFALKYRSLRGGKETRILAREIVRRSRSEKYGK